MTQLRESWFQRLTVDLIDEKVARLFTPPPDSAPASSVVGAPVPAFWILGAPLSVDRSAPARDQRGRRESGARWWSGAREQSGAVELRHCPKAMGGNVLAIGEEQGEPTSKSSITGVSR